MSGQPINADIRQPMLTGYHKVAGLWLPHSWYNEAQRRDIILKYWHPGTKLYAFEQGTVIRFATPFQTSCQNLSGWPLVLQGAALSSAIFTDEERKALKPADCYLVEGGYLTSLHFKNATHLDPTQWFSLQGYTLIESYMIEPKAITQPIELPTIGKDTRDVLGDIMAPPTDAQKAMLKEFQDAQQKMVGDNASQTHTGSQKTSGIFILGEQINIILKLSVFVFIVFSLVSLRNSSMTFSIQHIVVIALSAFILYRIFGRIQGRSGTSYQQLTGKKNASKTHSGFQKTPGKYYWGRLSKMWNILLESQFFIFAVGFWVLGGSAARAFPIMPILAAALLAYIIYRAKQRRRGTLFQQKTGSRSVQNSASFWIKQREKLALQGPSAWRNLLVRLANMSGLSKTLSRKQSKYLKKSLALFEQGDLLEALRHAVPLSSPHDFGLSDGQSFGGLGPRDNLQIRQQRGGRHTSLFLDEELSNYMSNLYRKAFNRLDMQGRIDEAAFTLIELLGERQQGLDYLEKHERYKEAAKFALAWDMPSDVIVRLFCLAEEWSYALTVARRDNAFANAVLMLEKNNPKAAERLREEWSESLISQGEWLAAIDVLWPLKDKRQKAEEWLLQMETYGGELEAAALVKRALLLPDTLERYGDIFTKICQQPETTPRRRLVTELLALKETPKSTKSISWLANGLLRPVIRDQLNGSENLSKNDFFLLLKLADNPLLRADLPTDKWPDNNRPFSENDEPQVFHAPNASVSRTLKDVVAVCDQQYLLALGEAGVLLIDKNGRKQNFFNTPATDLVISHNREVALLVIKRESLYRVSRLELRTATITDLGTLPMRNFSRNFDGISWTIAMENRVQVLDSARELKPLWQLGNLPGSVTEIITMPHSELWLIEGEGSAHLWRYELPERSLRQREQVPLEGNSIFLDPPTGLFSGRFGFVNTSSDQKNEGGQEQIAFSYSNPIFPNYPKKNIPLPEEADINFLTLDVSLNKDWLILSWPGTSWLIHKQSTKVCATIDWPEHLQMREQDGQWLMYDGEGRLLHIDPETGFLREISIQ